MEEDYWKDRTYCDYCSTLLVRHEGKWVMPEHLDWAHRCYGYYLATGGVKHPHQCYQCGADIVKSVYYKDRDVKQETPMMGYVDIYTGLGHRCQSPKRKRWTREEHLMRVPGLKKHYRQWQEWLEREGVH